jgi:hypothetical protein
MPRHYECGFDEMEFLSLGSCNIDRDGSSLIVSADDLNSRLLAHSEDRMFWWSNIPAIYREKNIPWLDSSIRCGASCVDILKYPPLRKGRFVGKVRCA